MREVMIDLETLDTAVTATVLSIGAVVFEGELVLDRLYRIIEFNSQLRFGRTVSQNTLLWWMQQDPTARAEAFNPVRVHPSQAVADFNTFIRQQELDGEDVTRFWANPATFDFPIWESFCTTMGLVIPWLYNQKYDVRSVVATSGISVADHVAPEIAGIPHMPVYDCELQISLLNAARKKLGKL